MIAHTRPITLAGWVDQYELRHEITPDTTAYYRRSIRALEHWAGEPMTVETIRDDLVNGAILKMIRAGRSPHYARSLKAGVLAVWRDWADAGVVDYPRRIRPIRSGPLDVRIWTPEEVRQILSAARRLPGEFRNLRLNRAKYFETLILTCWDTALRRRDLHRLRRNEVGPDWVDRQNKTRKPIRARLRPSTLVAIDAWGRGPEALLWPLWGSDEAFRATWDRIVLDSGVAEPGPFKKLRKSAGTAAEAVCPGAGHLLLGNTRKVFERHYLAIAVVAGPQPPALS